MPMYTRNIFNKGNQKVPFTLKRQEYVTLNFSDNDKPIVIPYQVLHWYRGPSDKLSGNIKNWDALCDISWSASYHGARIAIEVMAITRQRLLQGGSTNYKTYDFETSQNLMLGKWNREATTYQYPLKESTDAKTAFNEIRTDASPFNYSYDHVTREEIPQRKIKFIHVEFNEPNHNYYHNTYKTNGMISKTGTSTAVVLIPGPQGVSMPTNKIGFLTGVQNNKEIFTNTQTQNPSEDLKLNTTTTINRASYPMMALFPPEVADETGEMKWVYQVRFSTELFATFHLNPDIGAPNGYNFLKRQVIPCPTITQTSTTIADQVPIDCIPYEV